tara:strand:+ start:3010 stop:4317 length:1308 start_codon:yes stop_codon:yes gene_type:complete
MGNELSRQDQAQEQRQKQCNQMIQQHIIQQLRGQQLQSQQVSNNNNNNTKNIRIYDKRQQYNVNENRSDDKYMRKQLQLEREQLQRREEILKQKEILLQKKMNMMKNTQNKQNNIPTQNNTVQQSPRKQFTQFQQQRKQEFSNEMNELHSIKVNPYDIFKIPENFTLEQLKKEYKKLALKYHPDRPTGDELKFKIVTKIYLALYEEYKRKQPDKQYLDLKNSSHDFIQRQESCQKHNKKCNKDNFNIKLFNKIYEENKLFEPTDDGYGKWLQSQSNDETNTTPKPFSKSFNLNVFNTTFNNERKKHNQCSEVIEYKDPEAQGTSMEYGNLGQDTIKDFSSHHNGHMNYSDVKKAYTDTFLIHSEKNNREQYKDVNEVKSQRNNISFVMNEQDKQRQQMIDERIRNEELLRQQRVQKQDHLIHEHYRKMNHLFLEL